VPESNPIMFSFLPALLSAFLWAVVPIYYRDFLRKGDTKEVNFIRLVYAGLALLVPTLLLGIGQSFLYGMLSGVFTLALGDTTYFLSIKNVGASIAAPIAFTFVLFDQFTAALVGEPLRATYLLSVILIIVGVYVLSKSDSGSLRIKGIVMALTTSLFWTVGHTVLKLATINDANPVSITFARIVAAIVVLGLALLIRPSKVPSRTTFGQRSWLAFLSTADIAVGSTLFTYSIGALGLSTTIIVVSVSPFLTQIMSKLLGKETPSRNDFIAGLLLVIALMVAVL